MVLRDNQVKKLHAACIDRFICYIRCVPPFVFAPSHFLRNKVPVVQRFSPSGVKINMRELRRGSMVAAVERSKTELK